MGKMEVNLGTCILWTRILSLNEWGASIRYGNMPKIRCVVGMGKVQKNTHGVILHTHTQFCLYHTDPYTYVQVPQRDQREPSTTWRGGEGSWDKGGRGRGSQFTLSSTGSNLLG